MSTAYHSQTDDQSEKTNQIFKTTLRFFITKNPKANWISILSLIQANINNSSNATTELISNEIIYEFKMKNRLIAVSNNLDDKIMDVSDKELKKILDETRLRFWQKASDVVSFDNVKAKLMYDKKHKPLLLKKSDKAYLKLHKKYRLLENYNHKLSNQRCEPFLMKRRVDRLAYKLKLLSQWRVHSVISVTQLESANSADSYNRNRPHYFDSIKMKRNIEFEKSYEVKKIINKRIKIYEKTAMIQYFIRWLEYGPEYDEWKNLAALADCMNLIRDYENKNIGIVKKTSQHDSKKKKMTRRDHDTAQMKPFKKKRNRSRKLLENNN